MSGLVRINLSPTATWSGGGSEQRARCVRLVIAVLRERARASSRSGSIPRALERGIADFSADHRRIDGPREER